MEDGISIRTPMRYTLADDARPDEWPRSMVSSEDYDDLLANYDRLVADVDGAVSGVIPKQAIARAKRLLDP